METWRVQLVREGAPEGSVIRFRGPPDVAAYASSRLASEPGEVMLAFALNTVHEPIGCCEVSRGILDAALIHPREVFRAAILANAAALILVHNHPSGDLNPSQEDWVITRKLRDAGQVIGIPLLDHLIVSHTGGFVSMAEDPKWTGSSPLKV